MLLLQVIPVVAMKLLLLCVIGIALLLQGKKHLYSPIDDKIINKREYHNIE